MDGEIDHKNTKFVEEQCPKCGSLSSDFDEFGRFYECNICKNLWAFDKDDPDYDDVETCPECSGTGMDGKLVCMKCDGLGTRLL